MINLSVLLLFLIFIIVKYIRLQESLRLHNIMGCDIPSKFIVGHLHKVIGHSEDRMNMLKQLANYAYSNKHGAATIWMGPFIIPVFANADQVVSILKTTNSKGHIRRLIERLVGDVLSFAKVKIWQPRRKLLLPSFSSKHLSQFVHVFESQSKIVVNKFQSQVGNGNVSIWNNFNLYFLDSVCETAFGMNLKIQKQETHPFFEVLSEYVKKITNRMYLTWLRFDVLYKILPISKDMDRLQKNMYNYIDELILQKQKLMTEGEDSIEKIGEAEPSKVAMESFLESMIKKSDESGRKYTNEELRNEILTLGLAGTDISAIGTCFTIVLLSQYPEIQEKVYQEILEVLDDDRPIELGDLQKLKYMDAVIKESLRLYPPVPFIFRYLKLETKLPSGLMLPDKQTVLLNIWGIHHNPQHWGPDVEDFNPDRFLFGPPPAAGTYIPFSMGPRNCIGYQYAMLSMKAALVTLLKAYRLKPATSYTYGRDNPLRISCDLMTRHVNNYEIQIENRTCQ